MLRCSHLGHGGRGSIPTNAVLAEAEGLSPPQSGAIHRVGGNCLSTVWPENDPWRGYGLL